MVSKDDYQSSSTYNLGFCAKVFLNTFIHLLTGTISNLNLIVLQVSNALIFMPLMELFPYLCKHLNPS